MFEIAIYIYMMGVAVASLFSEKVRKMNLAEYLEKGIVK